MKAVNCHDMIEKGDEVEIEYNEHSGEADEEPGELVKDSGTVKKIINSLGGGIYLSMNRKSDNEHYKLHNVEGGTVTKKTYRTVRVGVNAKIRKA